VGESFRVTAEVKLGGLKPEEVDVELYYGLYRSFSELSDSRAIIMEVAKELGNGSYQYGCTFTCETAGRFGFSVRATPKGDSWIKFTPGLLTWALD